MQVSAAVYLKRLIEKVLSIPLSQSALPSLDKQREAEQCIRQTLDGLTCEEWVAAETKAAEILASEEFSGVL
jgi:hypothetical protein